MHKHQSQKGWGERVMVFEIAPTPQVIKKSEVKEVSNINKYILYI
jgi:hypothetical protein